MFLQKIFKLFLVSILVVATFTGCSNKDSGRKSVTVFIQMQPNQQKYFRNKILAEFEKTHNCDVSISQFDKFSYIETALALQKEKKDSKIFLVKVPFEMTRVLVGKGLMEPLENIVSKEVLEKDFAPYHPLAHGLGIIDEKLYYIPRKLETRIMFYMKSKTYEAVENWKKFKKDLNTLLKKQNGYGLPKNYSLESDPEQWDYYDIFVLGYYWSHNKYFNMNVYMPRIAHRGDRYTPTALGLIDRAYQFGATVDDIKAMDSDPVAEMYKWEAVYIKNNIYNSGMWDDPWRGSNLYEAVRDGKVFLTILQQIDFFNIHGWEESPEMRGFMKDPSDMGVASMPKAVSFDLDKNGAYKKIGSKKVTTGGWWWGIPKTSPDKKLAYELAKFISSRDVQAQECSEFGMLPVRKDILINLSETFSLGWVGDIYRVSINQIDINGFTTVPLVKEYTEIGKNYIEAWYEMCVNKYSKNKKDNVDFNAIRQVLKNKYGVIEKQILKNK